MVEAKLEVSTDLEAIRAVLDIQNVLLPETRRIRDTEYKFYEGLILARRDLGTITTPGAEQYVKDYVGKPGMEARSYRNYRNSLVSKGWLKKVDRQYFLPTTFDLHGREVKKAGEIGRFQVTILRK